MDITIAIEFEELLNLQIDKNLKFNLETVTTVSPWIRSEFRFIDCMIELPTGYYKNLKWTLNQTILVKETFKMFKVSPQTRRTKSNINTWFL